MDSIVDIETKTDVSLSRNAKDETPAHSVFAYPKGLDQFDGESSYEIIKLMNNIDILADKPAVTPFML